MKLLRLGVMLLAVGISMLVVADMRARSIDSGSITTSNGLIGPLLLEPREALIALRRVDPPVNLTLTVVSQSGFDPNFDIGKTDGAFSMGGLMQSDTIIFRIPLRGLYYVVVTNETGQLTGTTSIRLEQRGFESDFLFGSEAVTVIGAAIVALQGIRQLVKMRRGNK